MVEINVLDTLILPLSVLSSVYFLPSVVCWAYNVPSLQIPVPKSQKDGNAGFRDLPLASPYTTSLSESKSGLPALEPRDHSAPSCSRAAATTQGGEQQEALVGAHRARSNSSR